MIIIYCQKIWELVKKKTTTQFLKSVYFITKHQKLLNSKLISKSINYWNNIFGENKYPPSIKIRQNCCNIFIKSSYELFTNLKKFYLDKIKKTKYIKTKDKKISLFKSFLVEINLVVNFGLIHYQIFNEKYNKKEYKEIKRNEFF